MKENGGSMAEQNTKNYTKPAHEYLKSEGAEAPSLVGYAIATTLDAPRGLRQTSVFSQRI